MSIQLNMKSMRCHCQFLSILLLAPLLITCNTDKKSQHSDKPNILILFVDDMGYGDLSSYGHPTIKTPNIDGLADQGIRFTSFLTANWCVPSRTQLLIGQYMPRVDFGGGTGANGKGGLPENKLTLAEGLKDAGYVTGMTGKWHLGHYEDRFLPPNQGFDSWFGLPYSHDYRRPWVQTDVPLGLLLGTKMVEHPFNQDSLTVRYTEEATNFLQDQANSEQPFFFYLAYNMPHLPIHTTKEFRGQSAAGLYGDVIETIDWSVGQVLKILDQQGFSDNTIVFFASDNGPWLNMPERMKQEGNELWHAGSPGPLRGAKGTTYEGGQRVPAIIRWPDHINSNQVSDELLANPDMYRTFLEAGRAELPDYKLDGYNLIPFLTGQTQQSPRKEYAYFRGNNLEAIRTGKWKLRLADEGPQLFNLQVDPAEQYNRAEEKPEVVERLTQNIEQFMSEMGAEKTQE